MSNDHLVLAKNDDMEDSIHIGVGPTVYRMVATAFTSKSYELKHPPIEYLG